MKLNASDALIKTLINNGLEVVFANPGTSEMHLVAAIDHNPKVRPVLGLFEGVVSGAADGYARMSGKAAANLLHFGPGLGNAFANIHNARKAKYKDEASYQYKPFIDSQKTYVWNNQARQEFKDYNLEDLSI